jgi:hypothetical protein
MSLLDRLESALILGPIIALFVLGLYLTLRSGVVSLSDGGGLRRVAENLCQTLLMLTGGLIGLAIIQQMVGMHLALLW